MSSNRIKTLWDLTRGQQGRYAAAILAMWVGQLFLFTVPLVALAAIDGLRGDAVDGTGTLAAVARALGGRGLWVAAGWIVALTGLAGAFAYVRGRWAARASESIVRSLRDRLFAHIAELPSAYHDAADTGDLVQRCSSDVETVRVFLSSQVVEIGRAILLLATVVPILVALDGTLALIAIAIFPLIIGFAAVFFRKVKAQFLEVDEAEGRMTSVLQENLTGIRVVRAFARQDFEIEKFDVESRAFRDETNRLIRLLGSYWFVSELLIKTQFALVLFGGAWFVAEGRISVGTLWAFLSYEGIVMWPVSQLGRVLTDAGKAIVALRRLGEILVEPVESGLDSGLDGEAGPRAIAGALEFEHLGFSYGDGAPVLADVSFRVRAGETVALLGPPGAGKSTLIHLLLRLYDYESGSIRVDGMELRELPRRFVRSQIAAVLQEPFLYSKTIGENVRLGKGDATRDEIVQSTSVAAIHESIEAFEAGYDTVVGERGVTLSGGQRQRLALARALLADAPILVLDDAFSAVDTRTESAIRAALAERRGKRTTLLIAHRLSSIQHADRILVLDEGRIVQSGTHDELARVDGPYRRLWRIQGALEDEIGRDLALAPDRGGGS